MVRAVAAVSVLLTASWLSNVYYLRPMIVPRRLNSRHKLSALIVSFLIRWFSACQAMLRCEVTEATYRGRKPAEKGLISHAPTHHVLQSLEPWLTPHQRYRVAEFRSCCESSQPETVSTSFSWTIGLVYLRAMLFQLAQQLWLVSMLKYSNRARLLACLFP